MVPYILSSNDIDLVFVARLILSIQFQLMQVKGFPIILYELKRLLHAAVSVSNLVASPALCVDTGSHHKVLFLTVMSRVPYLFILDIIYIIT